MGHYVEINDETIRKIAEQITDEKIREWVEDELDEYFRMHDMTQIVKPLIARAMEELLSDRKFSDHVKQKVTEYLDDDMIADIICDSDDIRETIDKFVIGVVKEKLK